MKFYVCVPHTVYKQSSSELSDMKLNLISDLQRYYGVNTLDIEFIPVSENKITAIIMGKPKYEGNDTTIKDCIIQVLQKQYNQIPIDVKLNYGAFNPNYKPTAYHTPQPKTSTVNDSSTQASKSENNNNEFDYDKLSMNYHAELPRYSFDQVILPETTRNQIEEAIGVIQVESKVFDEWGLRSIIPTATSALSFYGPPGTGKSMAAEAVAQKMGKKILSATYADIESKFHGEGPKMVKAIFRAAEREDAVLFLDESDSLLSKRLTNVSDGSAQAINSMRSQLLISLERFKGIVIFATNLVVNYDKAFLSRLINIEFQYPDKEARTQIWLKHLKADGLRIPLADDIDIEYIAGAYEFCGRDIKNAVKNACVSVALRGKDIVTQTDLINACEKTKMESDKVINANDHTNMNQPTLTPKQSDSLKKLIQDKLDESQE